MIIKVALILFAFLGMEGVAWFTHKYVMHGFLWFLHKDHHEPHSNVLEKNDFFAIFFSLPSILMIFYGVMYPEYDYVLYLGIGIALYGLFYFIFHDIIVHRRVKIKFLAKSAYMKRLIRAHKIHHKTLGKEGASSFGFLFAHKKYDVE